MKTLKYAVMSLVAIGCAGCNSPARHDPFNIKFENGVHLRDVEHCKFDLTLNEVDGSKILVLVSVDGTACKITVTN